MTEIYHICSRSAAQAARQSGEYRAESLLIEGFIHFSQLHQVAGVANSFYKGLPDQVVLVVNPDLLKAELKYEAPVHPNVGAGSKPALVGSIEHTPSDQLFPHLYGPLNFNAVIKVIDLPEDTKSFLEPQRRKER